MDEAEAREYHDTLLRHFRDKLTEWEVGFLESVDLRLKREQPLSERQVQILDDLMTRCQREYGRRF